MVPENSKKHFKVTRVHKSVQVHINCSLVEVAALPLC